MVWEELIVQSHVATLPWLGGRVVHGFARSWTVAGALPPEHGWQRFSVSGARRAIWVGAGEADDAVLSGAPCVRGYLVGDRVIPDDAKVAVSLNEVFAQGRSVWLAEEGLGRFARVTAGRQRDGKLVYLRQEFPLGPEGAVAEAFEERRESIDDIPGVPPALHVAFLWHTWRRMLADAERQRVAEAIESEKRRAEYQVQIGELAAVRVRAAADFETAAREALAVSGAELLDERPAGRKGERVVVFRFLHRRFECVVHGPTLRVIDAGICLEDHDTGVRGDTRFTLESLPAVISEAAATHRLVVFRNVHG